MKCHLPKTELFLWRIARICACLFAVLSFEDGLGAKNYIRYHQLSLQVHRYMLDNDHVKALDLLAALKKRYGLMPTETFVMALCQAGSGDTTAARLSYLLCLEQRAPFVWLFMRPPQLQTKADSSWYSRVVHDCEAVQRRVPPYADGPVAGIPTPLTELNRRHQALLDSLGSFSASTRPDAQRVYDAVVQQHDRKLDSMLSRKLRVPSVATYGINTEFETFLFHCSPDMTHGAHRRIKRWLKRGLIYPRTYSICFDNLANKTGSLIPFGYFNGLRPEELAPGHAERRAAIGMGDETLENQRFHTGLP